MLRRFYYWLIGRDYKTNELADRWGCPRIWVTCVHCGAQRWRLPPHNMNPCPLVKQMADSAGMKFDAERNLSIRSGQQLEQVSRFFEQQFEQFQQFEPGEEEEDESE